MQGKWIWFVAVAAFAAWVVYMAAGQFTTQCEVCMRFNGRTVCEVALASDRDSAQMQATTSACAQLANGVNETMACTGARPHSMACRE